MKKRYIQYIAGTLCLLIACLHLNAQFTISGQLRTRSELRDGQGAPLTEGARPAFFTSQRTRLNFFYNTYRLKLGLTAQDVRVWGQDASTINKTTSQDNNGFMLHEAWAEIFLTDTTDKNESVSLKIGRQELIYDDQRLLGNLDWLQQGRRHDAALLKYEKKSWVLHLAGAFNQNRENASGTIYNSTPAGNYTASTNGGSMYKNMEFIYLGKKLKKGNASFLFFNDQFSKYQTGSDGAKVFTTGTWSRSTTGFYFNNTFHKIALTASAYYQFGKNASGQKLKAGMLTALAQYSNGMFTVGPGLDYTSGGTSNNTVKAFDPLYGTPHKFWGLMDYFYAASPFGKGGLLDYHLKTKWKTNDRLLINADFHQFSSATGILNAPPNKRSFGQELDFTGSYIITKQVTLEGGFSHFFTTSLLSSTNVKKVTNARSGANWAYIMFIIKPEFILK